MVTDAALLEGDAERTRIESAMQKLQTAMAGTDHRAIMHLIEALDETASAFAGRRMDLRIREALTGRSVKDVAEETAHAAGTDAHTAVRDAHLGNKK